MLLRASALLLRGEGQQGRFRGDAHRLARRLEAVLRTHFAQRHPRSRKIRQRGRNLRPGRRNGRRHVHTSVAPRVWRHERPTSRRRLLRLCRAGGADQRAGSLLLHLRPRQRRRVRRIRSLHRVRVCAPRGQEALLERARIHKRHDHQGWRAAAHTTGALLLLADCEKGARLARDAHLRALRLVARAAASGEAARRGLRAARSHRALHRHADRLHRQRPAGGGYYLHHACAGDVARGLHPQRRVRLIQTLQEELSAARGRRTHSHAHARARTRTRVNARA
mmetsp:Transcript_25893/g.56770  ORF Transcript_25893/g.56770 Transcript_25893/m.56770 type:complete len:280 (-) Transcript_25893:326-1165(-)